MAQIIDPIFWYSFRNLEWWIFQYFQ